MLDTKCYLKNSYFAELFQIPSKIQSVNCFLKNFDDDVTVNSVIALFMLFIGLGWFSALLSFIWGGQSLEVSVAIKRLLARQC